MPKCPRTRSSRISLAEILVVTDRPVPRSGTVFSRGPGGSAVEVVGRSLIVSRQQGFHALTDKLRNGNPPACRGSLQPGRLLFGQLNLGSYHDYTSLIMITYRAWLVNLGSIIDERLS